MRTPEETLQLLEKALEKRRAYLRRMAKRASLQVKTKSRPQMHRQMSHGLRSGMLSELNTIAWTLRAIKSGDIHPDELYNKEDDPPDEEDQEVDSKPDSPADH